MAPPPMAPGGGEPPWLFFAFVMAAVLGWLVGDVLLPFAKRLLARKGR